MSSVLLDVHVMLLLGFGLLMSFPRRLGLTALSMTVLVVAIAGQWAILFAGLARMGTDGGATITIGMHE